MSVLRIITSVALSLALASSISAMPSQDTSVLVARELQFNPVGIPLVPLNGSLIPAKPAKRMTNAQRLARGLPLNRPHRRAPGASAYDGCSGPLGSR